MKNNKLLEVNKQNVVDFSSVNGNLTSFGPIGIDHDVQAQVAGGSVRFSLIFCIGSRRTRRDTSRCLASTCHDDDSPQAGGL